MRRLRIERLLPGGEGEAWDRDGRLRVPGTVPGDRVEVLVGPAGPEGRAFRLLRVLEPSPDRVSSPCPVFESCGGCDWSIVSPELRRASRAGFVRDALGADVDLPLPTSGGRECGCRRVARLAVGRDARGPVLGFRSPRSHRVISATGCPALEPELSDALTALSAAPFALATWPTGGSTPPELWMLSDRDRRVHLAAVSPGGGRVAPDAIDAVRRLRDPLPESLRPTSAELPRVETVDGGTIEVPLGSFVQAHREVGLLLARRVAQWVGDAPGRVVELFAGSGFLTVSWAGRASVLRAVESNGAASAALGRNLAARGVPAEAAVHGDAARAFESRPAEFDLVVADPPRTGLRAASGAVARAGVPRLILVSCDAGALARDAIALRRAGYRTVAVELVDMFPRTHHLEVLTVWELGRNDPLR